jgi:hypothetical protein
MKTFIQWLEDAGIWYPQSNAEDAAFSAKGIRSRIGAASYPKDPEDKMDEKKRLLGFMKSKMKKK